MAALDVVSTLDDFNRLDVVQQRMMSSVIAAVVPVAMVVSSG
jgi:hypothetical protein